MYDSPITTLQELCWDFICNDLANVFEVYYEKSNEIDTGYFNKINKLCPSNFTVVQKKFRFRHSDMFLFNDMSEQLLAKFVEKNILCDATLSLFTVRNTNLKSVRIKNTRKVTPRGLKMLAQHQIVDLECINLKNISIGKILDSVGHWIRANLTSLNVSQCSFIDTCGYSLMVRLTDLKNLRSLNVSYTELNQQTLRMICEDLAHLEKLDISGTLVQDLTPLLLLADQLVSLTICDIKPTQNMVRIIAQLHNLRHLDMSLIHEKFETSDSNTINDILEHYNALKNLISLDLSGWREYIFKDVLLNYLNHHPKMKYLGIVVNHVAFESAFCDKRAPDFRRDLTIAGVGSEEQIIVALRRYCERPVYMQKALYHLFQLTSSFDDVRPDVFELVVPAMEAHPEKFGVQMAATACLYNLTRSDQAKHMHPRTLRRAVVLTMNAMECFPLEFQLQKNSLLTLCSDHILNEISLDRFRCAKLVMDALCNFEEENMNRMAVAICSILAARVSTAETSKLGASHIYMSKLLSMVEARLPEKKDDMTLKFTLSALWNLTDESAATCAAFLKQGGANLFLDTLIVFRNNVTIETKVLGLLNNIAEVEHLRPRLMLNALIDELYRLLQSKHIDVSYFAAGIVAHLTSPGDLNWTVNSHTRREMLDELGSTVSKWKVPDSEMVAYRSFRPFFSLLRRGMDYPVQLWAVWAIHHVCTKNSKRYCQMLRKEGVTTLLEKLITHESSHQNIRHISTEILETLSRCI